ncbi:hypothetical protein K8Z61_12920 [Nocardioides sp. TRM66260-LWL]|uniref:hypothetical protein n=1 Tax=Nocardioides sp. TRM66260-LWL TaxID=2874478 RepID=UPI001CC6F380|nr:hypothetical protein [Nocardioides sp. TRM66260-LWL]MBZ5735400.1 hypothetical protein [Nocardioides sp. TRM66260-LWL]
MSTATSSTEPGRRPRREGLVRPLRDVAALLAFRRGTGGRRQRVAAALVVASLPAAAVVPALTPDAGGTGRAFNLLVLLPTAMAALVVITAVSAIAGGGGRELLAREPAQVFPVSPTVDHLGALLLAPLTIAWMVQAWVLLGAGAYAVGPRPVPLLGLQLGLALWLLLATAVGQALAWTVEAVRRRPRGLLLVRGVAAVLVVAALAAQAAHRLVPLLDAVPTSWLLVGLLGAPGPRWGLTLAGLAVVTVGAVLLGAVPARRAARLLPIDEVAAETGHRRARPLPRSAARALVRGDRASVWRAVPMRRGLLVLALGPGLVAVLGDLPWSSLTLLPGLVISGGALLFGVNAWCLDGGGGRWRESLPVPPQTVFRARVQVLAEFLLAAGVLTVLVAGARAGVPRPAEASALVASLLVVLVQVTGASMRWSQQHPYAVDLRSARATPAPPTAMVGYSARLALATTVTGLVFSGLAQIDDWRIAPLLAVPMLAWSAVRLLRTRERWCDPVRRSAVVLAVTA